MDDLEFEEDVLVNDLYELTWKERFKFIQLLDPKAYVEFQEDHYVVISGIMIGGFCSAEEKYGSSEAIDAAGYTPRDAVNEWWVQAVLEREPSLSLSFEGRFFSVVSGPGDKPKWQEMTRDEVKAAMVARAECLIAEAEENIVDLDDWPDDGEGDELKLPLEEDKIDRTDPAVAVVVSNLLSFAKKFVTVLLLGIMGASVTRSLGWDEQSTSLNKK